MYTITKDEIFYDVEVTVTGSFIKFIKLRCLQINIVLKMMRIGMKMCLICKQISSSIVNDNDTYVSLKYVEVYKTDLIASDIYILYIYMF